MWHNKKKRYGCKEVVTPFLRFAYGAWFWEKQKF